MRRRRARTRILSGAEDGIIARKTTPCPLVARAEGEVATAIALPERELLCLKRRVRDEVVERVRGVDFVVGRQERVVLHVLSDIGRVNDGRDPESLRLCSGADTGEEH